MTHEAVTGDLPDAPEGAFDYLASLTEEADLSINNSHFKNSGGVGKEWFCPETGGQCAVFSIKERLGKGRYRFRGAHITHTNKIMRGSSYVETSDKHSSNIEYGEPPSAEDIEEMMQIVNSMLIARRSEIYQTNKKPGNIP